MNDPWSDLRPPYGTIVGDPPWPIRWAGGQGGRRRRAVPLAYSTMSIEDIAALEVERLAAADAHLFLWITPGLNREGVGVAVARAWGFTVVGEIVWEKPNLGMGAMPRNCHEIVLVARRGQPAWRGPRDIRSVQRWPQIYARGNGGKVHSAKPAAFFDLVQRVSPGPYVELFARQPQLGWDHWGHGFESGCSPC